MKQFLKRTIFSNPSLFAVYKKLRANETTLKRKYLTCKYHLISACQGNKYTPQNATNLAQQAIRARGIKTEEKNPHRLRIFLFGGNEAQDKTGFYQALDNLGELIVFKNLMGGYGPENDGTPFKKIFIEHNEKALLQQLKEENEKGQIDILIGQMWAHRISEKALKIAQAMGIITINVAMDDRLPWHWGYESGIRLGAIGLKGGIDLTLTTAPECCPWYWCENSAAIYFPLGSDPEMFKPAAKKIDVCFVGSKYGIREKIVTHLLSSGIKVEAFGPGWPNGHINSAQVADVFNKSKVILGIGTVGYNSNLFTLKLRDFDAPMAGALYLTHRNPDLEELFTEDEEIAFYMDEHEAAEKIKKFLASPALLEQMGSKARVKACQFYSWEKRLAAAFAHIGITIPETPVQAERQ